jgi:hypothetical protein
MLDKKILHGSVKVFLPVYYMFFDELSLGEIKVISHCLKHSEM